MYSRGTWKVYDAQLLESGNGLVGHQRLLIELPHGQLLRREKRK